MLGEGCDLADVDDAKAERRDRCEHLGCVVADEGELVEARAQGPGEGLEDARARAWPARAGSGSRSH